MKTLFSFRLHRQGRLLSAISLIALMAVLLPLEARAEPASKAKEIKAYCIIWLTTNSGNHPHVKDSDMYK